MKEETTTRLENILQNVDNIDDAESFVEEHGKDYGFFHEYLNEYIAHHNVEIPQLITKSGISRNYIYNIINGDTKNPGRDKVIAICIGAGMNLTELNRALKITGHNNLYPKNERDIYIAALVNQGIGDVTKINLELHSKGIRLLDV